MQMSYPNTIGQFTGGDPLGAKSSDPNAPFDPLGGPYPPSPNPSPDPNAAFNPVDPYATLAYSNYLPSPYTDLTNAPVDPTGGPYLIPSSYLGARPNPNARPPLTRRLLPLWPNPQNGG
jgi:hypothetical protein